MGHPKFTFGSVGTRLVSFLHLVFLAKRLRNTNNEEKKNELKENLSVSGLTSKLRRYV